MAYSNSDKINDRYGDLRTSIMEYAWDQFYKYGLRQVKVDQLAAHFSISKRTLYELFDDKEKLIMSCFEMQFEKTKKDIEAINKQSGSILEKYVLFICQRIKDLGKLNPLFYEEAGKYPNLVKFLEKTSLERNKTAINFIYQCIKEDLLIKEFNYNIILEVYNLQLTSIVKLGLYKKYKMEDILNTMSIVLFKGCCTPKGLKVLEDVRCKLKN